MGKYLKIVALALCALMFDFGFAQVCQHRVVLFFDDSQSINEEELRARMAESGINIVWGIMDTMNERGSLRVTSFYNENGLNHYVRQFSGGTTDGSWNIAATTDRLLESERIIRPSCTIEQNFSTNWGKITRDLFCLQDSQVIEPEYFSTFNKISKKLERKPSKNEFYHLVVLTDGEQTKFTEKVAKPHDLKVPMAVYVLSFGEESELMKEYATESFNKHAEKVPMYFHEDQIQEFIDALNQSLGPCA